MFISVRDYLKDMREAEERGANKERDRSNERAYVDREFNSLWDNSTRISQRMFKIEEHADMYGYKKKDN